jgi:hypothetical protein
MLQILPGWNQLLRNGSRGRRRRAGFEGSRRLGSFATAKKCPSTIGSHSRRPAFEILEERAMLSVAQDIQNQIAPYQSALSTALDVATSLPLVGKQFKDLQELDTLLTNALSNISAQTQNVTTSGHFQLAIPLTTISHTFTFDLGLDALLQVSTSGGVAASLTPTLNVGFDFDGTSATLDTAHTNLDLGFSLTLPNFQATASLHGLLYTHISDASLANQPGTAFTGHLKFGFDNNNGVSPQFSGDAHVRLDMAVSFVDPALHASFNPTFYTQFQVDWSLDTASNHMQTPYIAFKNFSLDVDSFTHNFLGDIVKTAQKYTKPLQPFIDIFETPVPILSAFDSSETVGDLLLKGAALSEDQQDRFDLMIKVIKTVNTIDLSGSTGGAVLNFGDINLSGAALDSQGDLLAGFGFDTSQLSGVVDDIFNSPLLGDLKDTLQSVASYTGLTSSAGFKFPVLEDPGPVIGGILTGTARDMFTFTTGREHFELAPSIGVGIENVVGVFLSAGIIFDASFSMGYDTAGLIKLMQDPLHKPEDLLHGFYFDNSVDTSAPPIPNVSAPKKTALYLQGFAEISASAIVTLSGGLYANVNVELASANTSSHVYLDDMIANISSPAKVFKLSGQVYAAATIELTLPNPIGPDITLFSYELSKDVLVDFDPPPQPSESKPLFVIDVTNDHTLELDVNRMAPGASVLVQPFHDYNLASQGYLADGIRVDYPGAIVMYVERKNDVTSNYYNLIGINGAVPDGVSISVIDPFRMFADEGVNSPAPGQTTPGVVFAGGRNVNYKYVEASDGSHAKVLLAGGYGSSTLTGGTLEFGNFIPAARLDQAEQHFGDTSGFDASGVALINSTIDADIAPANPAGIIGSTMTASRGGVMLGGPGANSFIATGPGNYEMIGGAWVDTFNITPSFGGVPATYYIDAGGGANDSLVVRVPTGENVTFENAPVADKYTPAFKALAVQANAGLSATAHGLRKVKIIATSGSQVTLGDTSELNIDFSIVGGAHLVFGGTNAPDIFSVTATGPYHGLANHYSPARIWNITPSGGGPTTTILTGWDGVSFPLPDPVYSVTRTFGTNGRTQTIPFAVHDAAASSVELNAGGASDSYSINLGLGAFIDVGITDTDSSSTNPLTVSTGDGSLIYNTLKFTDTAIELDYYTQSYLWSNYPSNYHVYMTSVHYTPTVTFSGNIVPSVQTAIPFDHVAIDRPLATQAAQLSWGGSYTSTPIPYPGLGLTIGIWDLSTNPWTYVPRNPATVARDVQVLANAGSLSISSTTEYGISINVLANSGTVSVSKSGGTTGFVDGINVLGNTGVVNVNYATTGAGITGQVNVGGALQSVANVHGTINMTGRYGLTIDDRGHSGAPPSWLIATTHTQIGDLGFNYDEFGPSYQAFWKTGSPVTYRDRLWHSSINLNGLTTFPHFPISFLPPSILQNTDGENVVFELSNYLNPTPSGTTTYGAANLPPGLSLNSATGRISGTIPYNAYNGSPYSTLISATNGQFTREWTIEWDIYSAISIYIPHYEGVDAIYLDEAAWVSFDPISVSDFLNRTPVVTVTGLPPGLSFDSNTGVISGTIAAGASTHGPYEVHLHADDGLETNDIAISMILSGIQLTSVPAVKLFHDGDAVDFNLNATTTSGGTLTYSGTGLPAGITLNTATGQITGTLAANASDQMRWYVEVTFDDGYSTKISYISWTVLPIGVTDQISIGAVGPQFNLVGDLVFLSTQATSALNLPIQFLAQGLPPGLGFDYSQEPTAAYMLGTLLPAAALNTPYQVTITATNGLNSASTTFTWQITGPQPPALPGDFNGSGVVDQADYGIWRGSFGLVVTPYSSGDANGNGRVDNADYVLWRKHLGESSGGGGGSGTATSAMVSIAATNTNEAAPTHDNATDPSGQAGVDTSLLHVTAIGTTPGVSRDTLDAAMLDLLGIKFPIASAPLRSTDALRPAFEPRQHSLDALLALQDVRFGLSRFPGERIVDNFDGGPELFPSTPVASDALDSCFEWLGARDTQFIIAAKSIWRIGSSR